MIIRNNDLSKKFFHGAFVLTLSSIFIKILSALYRIPYQNVVGDVGFFIYQQVYPFYAFALVLSTYGFPVIISKLLAESKGENNGYNRTEIVVTSWLSLSIIGFILFLFLFLGADSIAGLMNDPMLTKSIRLIAFSFLFMPILSILKGMFQSRGNMVPTAVSQVTEQSVRVGCILLASFLFYRYGLSLYEVAEGALLGSVFGSLVSSIVLISYFLAKKKDKAITIESVRMRKSLIPLSRKIIVQGIIFSISSLILVFIQFMDALMIYPLLTDSGMEITEAKQWKGIYDRGQPLLHLGTAATISLSLTIVPLISKYKQQQNIELVKYYTELSFRLSLMLGMAAAVGLFWIIEPTNITLFTNSKGSQALSVLVVSIFFCSLVMTGVFILQSLGKSLYSIGIISLGLIVKFVLMIVLIPKYYIMGAAISTTIAFLVMAVILFILMRKLFKRPILQRKTVWLTIIASVGMTVALLLIDMMCNIMSTYVTQARWMSVIQVVVSVSVGAFVYLRIIIRQGLFTIEELALLPFGSKIVKLLPKNK